MPRKNLMSGRIGCTDVKKVGVSINEGSPGRVFFVFSDPESTYEWLTGGHDNPSIIDKIPDVEHVTLLPGEFIEAEWRGCEIVYDNKTQTHMTLDLVRLVRASKPANASGLLVDIHLGWVGDHILPFRPHVDEDITVVALTEETSRLNLDALFKDTEDDE